MKKITAICISMLLLCTFACADKDTAGLNVSFENTTDFLSKLEISNSVAVYDGFHQNMTKEDILAACSEKGYTVYDNEDIISVYPADIMDYSLDISVGEISIVIVSGFVDMRSGYDSNEEKSAYYKNEYDKVYSAFKERLGEPFFTEEDGYSVISTWVFDTEGNIIKSITPNDEDAWYDLMNDEISFIRLEALKDDFTGTPPDDPTDPEWGRTPNKYMDTEPITLMFGEGQYFKSDMDLYYKHRINNK